MGISTAIKCILITLLSVLVQAQQPGSEETQTLNPPALFKSTVELEYRLFSPEIIFQLGDDSVAMTPKAAGQPSLRLSRKNLNVSFNNSLSKNSKSGGFDLAYSWKNYFLQAYHVWASGYRVRLNPNTDKKRDLADRENMKGSSAGLLFLQGIDEASHFSMMTDRGPRDSDTVSTSLQYIYQIVLDRSLFEDSSAFLAGQTVQRKERTSLLPGLGAMISESTPVGYVFTSCSLGLGVIKETMSHTTGISEEKTDAAYAFSCLLNLVLQKQPAKVETKNSRWFGGLAGNVQMIQPFDKSLLGQRLFLVSAFVGIQF